MLKNKQKSLLAANILFHASFSFGMEQKKQDSSTFKRSSSVFQLSTNSNTSTIQKSSVKKEENDKNDNNFKPIILNIQKQKQPEYPKLSYKELITKTDVQGLLNLNNPLIAQMVFNNFNFINASYQPLAYNNIVNQSSDFTIINYPYYTFHISNTNRLFDTIINFPKKFKSILNEKEKNIALSTDLFYSEYKDIIHAVAYLSLLLKNNNEQGFQKINARLKNFIIQIHPKRKNRHDVKNNADKTYFYKNHNQYNFDQDEYKQLNNDIIINASLCFFIRLYCYFIHKKKNNFIEYIKDNVTFEKQNNIFINHFITKINFFIQEIHLLYINNNELFKIIQRAFSACNIKEEIQ